MALMVVGAAIYAVGAWSSFLTTIGYVCIRPSDAIIPFWGIMFGPLVGGIGMGLGELAANVFSGWVGVGALGGIIGTFLAGALPGYLVKDPTNMKQVIFHSSWTALLMYAIVSAQLQLFGWAPWQATFPVFLLHMPLYWVITPLLVKLFYPRLKARGLYWRERMAPKEM